MKTRAEAVRLIHEQLTREGLGPRPKGEPVLHGRPVTECWNTWAWHYGIQELRELMDFIYEGEPQSGEEQLDGLGREHYS